MIVMGNTYEYQILPSVVNDKHSIWDAEVGGSNPLAPIVKPFVYRVSNTSPFSLNSPKYQNNPDLTLILKSHH